MAEPDLGFEEGGVEVPGLDVSPTRVTRGIASALIFYSYVLSRQDAPVPERIHALRMLRAMLFEALHNSRMVRAEELVRRLRLYASSSGLRISDPPRSSSPGERLNSEVARWFVAELKKRDGEDIFSWLDRAAELVNVVLAYMRMRTPSDFLGEE